MIRKNRRTNREEEFYNEDTEAKHRTIGELKREWGIIKHDLEYNPFLTNEERMAQEDRLKQIERMIELTYSPA